MHCYVLHCTININDFIFELQVIVVLHCTTMNDTKSVSFNFRTTEEIKTFLDKLSKKYDRSVSYVINDLLQYFIENPPKSIPTDKKK